MDASVISELLYKRNRAIHTYMANMTVRDKRRMFALVRKSENRDPQHLVFSGFGGVTVGTFCVMQVVLSDYKRKRHQRD